MNLLEKIKKKDFCVAVIGLGYVGLPLLLRFREKGIGVIGLDSDKNKIDSLMKSKSYIEHIPDNRLEQLRGCRLTTDYKYLVHADCIIICVPTPLKKREPDLSYLLSVRDKLSEVLKYDKDKDEKLIVLESTTYPGCTQEIFYDYWKKQGEISLGIDGDYDFFKMGVYLAFSPEREDPGNKIYSIGNIPKIVGGCTKRATELVTALYSKIVDTVVPVSDTKTAEMVKVLENAYRLVNIGFINEMKMICDRMGIDIWEVIHAASTKPFGFTPFLPSGGVGGHCIPIDPLYFEWKTIDFSTHSRMIEAAFDINKSMPYYVVDKIKDAFNKNKILLNGSNILICGVAYKKDIDDDRESPAYAVWDLLESQGAIVSYYDSHIPMIKRSDIVHNSIVEIDTTKYDAVVIMTDHSDVDYNKLLEFGIVIDTKNVMKDYDRLNIYKA